MAILDADVLLAIWLNEPLGPACLQALAALGDEPLYIADFNAIEVLLRSSTALLQSFEAGLSRIQKLASIVSLGSQELLAVCRLRSEAPALSLGDAYAAALALSREQPLLSTDKRFLKVKGLDPYFKKIGG